MAATKTSAPGTVYVALLRGINVGKARQVSMADLKDIAATLGHGDVRTHLRSGNLVLSASHTTASALAAALEEAIEARLGMRVGVVVRSAAELAAVLAADPL